MMLKNLGAASTIHIDDSLVMEHAQKGEPDSVHFTFTQKSKCGGGWCEPCHMFHSHQRPSWLKNDVSSTLLRKRRRKKESIEKKERSILLF